MDRGDILFIDDNENELRLLYEAFKFTEFPRDIVEFSNGADAFKYITEHVSDIFIILCDINMPGMSGHDLLEKINQDAALKLSAVPFIFLSNSAEQKDIERCYSLGAQSYFQKPYNIDEMAELLKLIINYWTVAHIPYHKYNHIHKKY